MMGKPKARKSSGKYVTAIDEIGEPCSPSQIRKHINSSKKDDESMISSQNVASAMNYALSVGEVYRLENGLYISKIMKLRMVAETPADEPI